MLASGVLPAGAGMGIIGPACGTLLCTGRNGWRYAVADLPDGAGGWYLVTNDGMTDPVNPPDGGTDIGLIHLGPDLLPRRINDGPGGDDPCGSLLVGGTARQEAVSALALGNGRYVLAGRETGFPPPPDRAFAWGFDGAAAPTFSDPFVSPEPFDVATGRARIAPDGSGGFYFAWERTPSPPYSFKEIFLARYDADGQPAWPLPVRLTIATTALWISAIAADPAGGAWVSWVDKPPGAPIYRPGYFVQHVRADATITLPPGGAIFDPRDYFGEPDSALLAVPGGVLMAASLGIHPVVHLIGEDGARPWGPLGREFRGAKGWGAEKLALLRAPDGSYRLLWNDRDPPWSEALAVARFEIDGTVPWPGSVTLVDGGELLGGTDAAFLPDGTLVAAAAIHPPWPSLALYDIAAQAIDGRGRLKTTAGGAAVCGLEGSSQSAPRLLAADDATVRLFWSDNRQGFGPDLAYNYFAGAVTFTSNPSLLAPAATIDLVQGESATILISGDDLDPAAIVSPGEGVAVVSTAVAPLYPKAPGDRLTVTVRADPGAAVGTRAIVVTNPDGESAAAAGYLRITLDARRIDIDGSGRTDGFDLAVLASAFGRARGEAGYRAAADIDGSGTVDGVDLAFVASRFGGPPQ